MAEYMLRRYHERMEYARKLLGGKCAHCRSGEQLQLDHVDWRSKRLTISRMWSVSWDRFVAEVSKCQLLCRTCHIEKSRKDVREIRAIRPGRNQYTGPRKQEREEEEGWRP